MLRHGFKVSIVVKQGMAMFETVGPDDEVDGFSDRRAFASQETKVTRRPLGQLDIQEVGASNAGKRAPQTS